MESVDNPERHQAQQTAARYEEEQARLRERLGSSQEHQAVSAAIGGSAVEAASRNQPEESEELQPRNAFQRLAALRRQQREVKLAHLVQQEQWRDEFFGNGLEGDKFSDGRQRVDPIKTPMARIKHVTAIGKSLAAGEIEADEALQGIRGRHNIVATEPDAQKKKFTKEIERTAARLERSSTPLRERLKSPLKKPASAAPRYPRPTTKRTGSLELANSLEIAADKVKQKVQEAKDNPEPESEPKKQR